jgi:hypothetical protein
MSEIFDRDRKANRELFRADDFFLLEASLRLEGAPFAPSLVIRVSKALSIPRVESAHFPFFLGAELFRRLFFDRVR